MKEKRTLFIFLLSSFLIFLHIFSFAAIDAPHNESNNVSCGSCHGQGLLDSPFWGGSGTYDQICLSCHNQPSGPYTPTGAPYVKTHSSENTSDKYGNWTRECRNCHNPHYQRQKTYKPYDSTGLYLVTGTITNCTYNGVSNESSLTYSTITYKSGWDSTKLTKKTSDYRRTILFPNIDKLAYNYPLIAVDTPTENTITVKGNACVFTPPTTFAAMYGQYIKDAIVVDNTNTQVKFFDRKGENSFSDGDINYNGVCEICHTQTLYHRKDGSGSYHYPATRCSICHFHSSGFANIDHTTGSGPDCEDCHGHDDGWNGGDYFGTTQSHSTHTENDSDDLKGPYITCSDCHDTNNYPFFRSGTDSDGNGKYDLSETDVCDNCHSPDGSYNGVGDASIGAKTNWSTGVYQGFDIKTGKEKWCAGCHDESPANSKADDTGIYAPNVIGDENAVTQYGTGYGFYKTGHGLSTGSYPASGDSPANLKCTDCHNPSYTHIDHDSRTYTASERNYQAGYRLKYSMDIPRTDTGWPISDFELCAQCHDINPYIQKTNLTSNLRNVQDSGNSTDLTETLLTDTSKSWDINKFLNDGAVLIPNIEKPWNVYPIISNTENTITVSGSMLTDGASVGDPYQVVCNEHRYHLQSWQTGAFNPYSGKKWDSDWSATSDGDMQVDSMISCPTCHNVHGSKYGRMVRDGELISKIYDRRPGLDFYYIPPTTYPNNTRLAESTGGHWSNGYRICLNCHYSPANTYSRIPGEIVSFSSEADQYFSVADPSTAISTITITDNPQAGSITATNDIRIRIPEDFNMTWDISDTDAVIGGTASAKVNSSVSFPDNKTLLIDVITDFSKGDTLTVSGLSFTNFSAISDRDNLELYIDGGHVLCAEDSKTIIIGTKAIISSEDNQTFVVGDWATEIRPITVLAITDSSDINITNDIRIKIPSAFPMVWDTSDDSAEITGNAASKVNSTVSFPDDRTLLIDVISDFDEGDEIIISGLSFINFYDVASDDNLELYVDGASDITVDAFDDKTIKIESHHWMSPVDIVRGYCSDEMSCYDTLIDGDLTTGNLWPGANGIFDLGKEYIVTHIRIYAQYDNKWRVCVYVGNTLTDCLTDGTDVTGLWRIGHDGTRWYEMAVTQASGRYLRLKWDNVGGYPVDNTLMEIEFFGIPVDGSSVTMTSAEEQNFEVGQEVTEISPITITESSSVPVITALNDIRVVIPSSLHMTWDTSDTVATIGGTASDKVNTTVSYPDDKTLLIDVTSNFLSSDTLTIEGLSFRDFIGQSEPSSLQLSVDGGSTFSATDQKTKRIWDWISPVDVVEGITDCCDLNGVGFLVDNDTGTGNTPWGGAYALLDLGDTYTITAIRIFSASTSYFNWDISVGSEMTDCALNSYGTMVKDEWYVPGDSQWHSTVIDPPVTGRYIRIDKDQGGGLDNKALREIDFQGYKASEDRYLRISSSVDQTFEKDQATTSIQPINIKYYPTNGLITATNDIRIKIPASFNMEWDTTDTVATIRGSAATKVSNIVSYPDNKTLLIDVTQDFSAGDTLSISDLSFTNFSDQSFKDHLQLSIDGGSTVAATDSKYIWIIHWKTPLIVYDGGCTSGCGMDNIIDGDTATGNCWAGGPVVFDIGDTGRVRHIRVWTNISRRWDARLNTDLTGCTTNDWPAIKWDWYPTTGQWSETPVIPLEGRYLKFYIDLGGPMEANTFMEFQYQSW